MVHTTPFCSRRRETERGTHSFVFFLFLFLLDEQHAAYFVVAESVSHREIERKTLCLLGSVTRSCNKIIEHLKFVNE